MPQRPAISAKPMPPAARGAVPAVHAHGRLPSLTAGGEHGRSALGASALPWGVPRVHVGRNPPFCAQGATGSNSPLPPRSF
jgi:hypothetical protein